MFDPENLPFCFCLQKVALKKFFFETHWASLVLVGSQAMLC